MLVENEAAPRARDARHSLIQRHAAADVGGHVEVFAVVDGRFTLLESALGNDLQRQRALSHF